MRILTIDISSSFPIFPGTEHKYPYDWRTKKPTIFRATEQWFASVEGFRHTAMDAIGHVKWVPPQVYYFSTFRCYIIPLICKMFFFFLIDVPLIIFWCCLLLIYMNCLGSKQNLINDFYSLRLVHITTKDMGCSHSSILSSSV